MSLGHFHAFVDRISNERRLDLKVSNVGRPMRSLIPRDAISVLEHQHQDVGMWDVAARTLGQLYL